MTTRLTTLLLIASLSNSGAAQVIAPKYTVEKFDIGEGSTDYLFAEAGTGRVFVSRRTHVMVIDGPSGKVIGDIPDTPRVHGIALAPKWSHGFTTNAGDSTVTMFDMKSLAPVKKIKIAVGGMDGIMYDVIDDRIVLTNHSKPVGTATVIDPKDGTAIGNVNLEDDAPEGATFDDRGRIFVNNEAKNTIQVFDVKTLKVQHSWPIAPCDGPTGIALDLRTNRIFSGCSKKSVVVDAATGKVVASILNGDGVDAVAWDPAEFLLYIPAGKSGNVTVVRMVTPNSYKVVATVPTAPSAKTITFDLSTKNVYLVAGSSFFKISH